MSTVEILEALMFCGFSISWYWSIARMMRTRQASGKSLSFVLIIGGAYMLGITAKVLAWRDSGVLSPLVWLYGWNLLVVAVDAVLVVVFSRPRRGGAERSAHRAALAPCAPDSLPRPQTAADGV